MFSAALFMQKWSNKKAKLVRQQFLQTDPTAESGSDEEDEGNTIPNVNQRQQKKLHITLRLNETREESETGETTSIGVVMYNQDEERFTQNSTLNLKTFALYRFSVETEEVYRVEYVSLGRKTYFNILEQHPDREFFTIVENPSNRSRICSFVYSTDKIRATDRHHRSVLPCSLKLKGYGELMFQLLVNFCYSNKNDHMTGAPLSAINLVATFGTETKLDNISYE